MGRFRGGGLVRFSGGEWVGLGVEMGSLGC